MNSFGQQSFGISGGFGLSQSINSKKALRNFSYDVVPLLSWDINIYSSFRLNRKLDIILELGQTSIGFVDKWVQFFANPNVNNVDELIPIHYFNYRTYNYYYFSPSLSINLHKKFRLNTGPKILMTKTKDYVVFTREEYIITKKFFGAYQWYGYRSKNFKRFNLAWDLGFDYKVHRMVNLGLNYTIGLLPFSNSTTKQYHQALMLSLGFEILTKKGKKRLTLMGNDTRL